MRLNAALTELTGRFNSTHLTGQLASSVVLWRRNLVFCPLFASSAWNKGSDLGGYLIYPPVTSLIKNRGDRRPHCIPHRLGPRLKRKASGRESKITDDVQKLDHIEDVQQLDVQKLDHIDLEINQKWIHLFTTVLSSRLDWKWTKTRNKKRC